MSYNLELWTDISAYKNGYPARPIDFGKMRNAGVDGVCIRKSLGYYQDVKLKENWLLAGEAGLKRTVYVVPFVGYDNARQLAAMIKDLDPLTLDRPMWIDLERAHSLGLQAGTNTAIYFLQALTTWAQTE